MQALHDLIQSMAKEEKRLYNLHAREGRFIHIYKAYVQAETFGKELDRQIFQKHFSTFSKAFYSMQKRALMDDILAVLLEYSNSAVPAFLAIRHQAKYQVLMHRGQADGALDYLQDAIQAHAQSASHRDRLRVLEDYRDALAASTTVDWPSYQAILAEIETCRALVEAQMPLQAAQQRLAVLLNTAQSAKDRAPLRPDAWDAVIAVQAIAGQDSAMQAIAFESEDKFSRLFDTPIERHKRLIAAEKASARDNFPRALRLHIITLLMESCMDCGDFLLINGIIYKANKEVPLLTPDERGLFLPRYLELCSFYHCYENELPTAQRETNELISAWKLDEAVLMRYRMTKVAFCIAANMPKYAQDAIQELFDTLPDAKNDLLARLMELMISVEANRRDEALVLLQKLRGLLRKSPDARKLSHYRLFLEMLQKHLTKKRVTWQAIPAFQFDWRMPLKPNLWLKAKMENKFYYNYILDEWQSRKRILHL